MNILIFGASGSTGQILVKKALVEGHNVTAFVRTAGKLALTHSRLRIFQGDVGEPSSVDSAIRNQEAVLSALGVAKPLKKDPVVVQGISHIVNSMVSNGIKRLIYLSFMAVGKGRADAGFLIKHIISRIVHNEIEDHEEKENIIVSSPLDWTIVQPPKLTNDKGRGKYRVGEFIKANSFFPRMSREDVADCMLKQLSDPSFNKKRLRMLY